MTDPVAGGQLEEPDELDSDELLELLDDDELEDEEELLDELEEELEDEELVEELEDELDDDELESSQHPSPNDSTSHLQLSAKCLAKP